ncbi:MAG TPA: hypothetical protein VGZ23_17480, partial [bacterium]|nr:hypothetical protein [bacterium]
IQDLVGQLSAVEASASLLAPQSIDLSPQLRAAAQRESTQLTPEFRRRMAADASGAEAAARRELDAYAAKVRSDQQVQFDAQQTQIQAAIQKAVLDKSQALQQDDAQFQQQTFEQYRLPLLNLHLKLDAVQPTDKKDADSVAQQIRAMTKERDDKIAAHDKANADALAAFQKQQQDAYTQQIKALQAQLSAQGQDLVNKKAAEISARLNTDLSAKRTRLTTELNTRMQADLRARQQALIAGARSQMVAAQTRAEGTLQVRVTSLQAQISEARAERVRLMATILADLRVESAALAQAKGWDLVLTRAVDAPDAPDATDDLIARIKK